MTDFSVETAARALVDARRTRKVVQAAQAGPASQEEAFAVQAAVARSLGPAGAWKVGGGGTAAPIAGSLVRPSPAVFGSHELFRIGIEAEIAFRFASGIPTSATPPDEAVVRNAITSVHAAIEVVDSRLDTWPVPDPLWALADNQNNGALVYAIEGKPFAGEDLTSAQVRLTAGERVLFEGEGRNPGGDPFALLVWLAGYLSTRGGLPPGAIVTTGSLSGVDFVEPGATVRCEIAGFPPVEVSFPS